MPFTASTLPGVPPGHVGFVAGRYRDGAVSDIWTDVQRCADRTFVAYLPACSCGWYGAPRPATTVGAFAARRAWQREHAVACPSVLSVAGGSLTVAPI